MKPDVSVIIPAYNHAAYIAQAISSVRAQRWPSLEMIVVDDGSTDETPQVLAQLKARDLQVVRQPHRGVASARNRAILHAHGEWIAFLDADDFWLENKLASQLGGQQMCERSFIHSGYVMVNARGAHMRVQRERTHPLSDLLWGNPFVASAMVIHRSLLARTGLFDPALSTGEDWHLWLRLALHGDATCIGEPLTAIRVGNWQAKGRTARVYESCTLKVLTDLFGWLHARADLSDLARQQARVLSWHWSVIAKMYLWQRDVANFLRCARRSLRTHGDGARFLLAGERALR